LHPDFTGSQAGKQRCVSWGYTDIAESGRREYHRGLSGINFPFGADYVDMNF